MADKNTFKDSALRAVAIIGLIAILLLGAWGIIQLALALPNFFGHSATQTTTTGTTGNNPAPAEQVTLTAPSSATSGSSFLLGWALANAAANTTYGYVVSYSCAAGLTFVAPLPDGSTREVPCNTPFNFTNATGNLNLTPKLSGTKPVTTTVYVAANRLSDGRIMAVGSSPLTINPTGGAARAATTGRTQPSTTYVAATAPRSSSLYGAPDLAVRIISVTPVGGRYSAQFEIANVGTNTAASGWTFNAALPLQPPYTFVSQPQQALYPGDKIVYTLGFDMQNTGATNVYPYASGCTSYTAPYSYPCSTYSYGNTYPGNCGYSTSFTYDGVANYPTTNYGCNNIYNNNGYYNYNTNCGSYTGYCLPGDYPPSSYPSYNNYGYSSYGYTGGTFSVTADPQNLVGEANEANNTASVPLPY